jgi:hypothetical protein
LERIGGGRGEREDEDLSGDGKRDSVDGLVECSAAALLFPGRESGVWVWLARELGWRAFDGSCSFDIDETTFAPCPFSLRLDDYLQSATYLPTHRVSLLHGRSVTELSNPQKDRERGRIPGASG